MFLFELQDDSPDLRYIGSRPLPDPHPSTDISEKDVASEDIALKRLVALVGTLEQHQRQHGEDVAQALNIRFQLVQALTGIGAYDEAEAHCYKVLEKESRVDVQILLATIYAKTDRPTGSANWLFYALTDFIVLFTKYTLEESVGLFNTIMELFDELSFHSGQDVVPLKAVIDQMWTTLQRPNSGGAPTAIRSQLFVHGFHLAHQCTVLNLWMEAKHLYKYLLEHPSIDVTNNDHAFEEATAHHMYGILLGNEMSWKSSAEQLLLACKCAMKSGLYDRRHIVLFRMNFSDLRPHLRFEPHGDTLAEKIENKLAEMQGKRPIVKDRRVSRVETYLKSDMPWHFGTLELSGIAEQLARLTLPVRSIASSQGDLDRKSTVLRGTANGSRRGGKSEATSGSGSMSWNMSGDGSHVLGTTLSEGSYPGLCDWMLE